MPKVLYDPGLCYDHGQGGLRVFCPGCAGWINYNFVRSVVPERNADVWRMSVINACAEQGQLLCQLTNDGAEWEMAVRLAGRPDFIGGFNHGDEQGGEPALYLDGERTAPEALRQTRDCRQMRLTILSTGYDPAAPDRAVFRHRKEFSVDDGGVHLQQEIHWLTEEQLDNRFRSYLAMMPPLKHEKGHPDRILTDSFAFDSRTPAPILRLPVESANVSALTVLGSQSGYVFTLRAEALSPRYESGGAALLTDNGGVNYHKMYITFAGGAGEIIPAGTVWRAATHYAVKKV